MNYLSSYIISIISCDRCIRQVPTYMFSWPGIAIAVIWGNNTNTFYHIGQVSNPFYSYQLLNSHLTANGIMVIWLHNCSLRKHVFADKSQLSMAYCRFSYKQVSPWHAQKTGCIVLHGMSLSHEHSISFRTSDGASSTSFGVVVGVRDIAFYSLDHPYAHCK